jgi:riboflavin biosynthesis pyrimidine reductase
VAGPSFEVLSGGGGDPLPAERPYGRSLDFPVHPRPYVVVNFVASIDGVASLGVMDGTDSTRLSGSSRADRYLMALLRARADLLVIGAGNVRATPGHQWTAAAVAGDQAEAIAAYRAELHGSAEPAPLVVVSATGDLPSHVALDQPATRTAVLTTASGATHVRAAHPSVEVITRDADGDLDGASIVEAISDVFGPALMLCEGGPSLFGGLLADRAAQELFLTVSPRIAGRDHGEQRPGIVEAWAADPDALRGAALTSVHRSDDHLFLRYRIEP